MLETKDLILDKAKFSDWEGMYRNVWSHFESAEYMLWNLTTTEDDAKIRIQKTIEFQKTHDTYLVYEKATGNAIGFAGVEKLGPGLCQEMGICLGPGYVGKGYGKQILQRLLQYSRETLGAEKFFCSARENNARSRGLIRSMGFQFCGSEEKTDPRNGKIYQLRKYYLDL